MDLGLVHMPVYTGLTASLLLVMHVVLMFRVIRQRDKSEVLIGTGGIDVMEQAVRVHANFIENSPAFLIGLMLIEMFVGSTIWVAVLGGAYVVGRISHAIGFSMSTGVTPGRLVGALTTMITILCEAITTQGRLVARRQIVPGVYSVDRYRMTNGDGQLVAELDYNGIIRGGDYVKDQSRLCCSLRRCCL